QDFRGDMIDVLVCDARRRIPAAGARRLVAFGQMLAQLLAALAEPEPVRHLVGRDPRHHEPMAGAVGELFDLRRTVAKLAPDRLEPQIGRFHYVRISGHQPGFHWAPPARCAPAIVDAMASGFEVRGRTTFAPAW